MRIAVCDDGILMTEKIQRFIKEYFEYIDIPCPEIVVYNSGEALLADKIDVNMMFLDFEMPGISGIHVGKTLKEENEEITIFIITSYAEYLDEAMKFQVFRYLSKPLDKQRFFKNFREAIDRYNKKETRIAIEHKNGVFTIKSSELIEIEAQGKDIIVRIVLGDFISVHSMQYWESKLPVNMFFRTHRSFIINYEYVNDFDHLIIHLYHRKYSAYLTRRRYSEFKKTIYCILIIWGN